MNWLLALVVFLVVVYIFNGRKGPKSGSLSMPKVISENKLVFGLLGIFALYWFMNNDLVEGKGGTSHELLAIGRCPMGSAQHRDERISAKNDREKCESDGSAKVPEDDDHCMWRYKATCKKSGKCSDDCIGRCCDSASGFPEGTHGRWTTSSFLWDSCKCV